MQTIGEHNSVLRGLFASTALAVFSLMTNVLAAPVPLERVQKLAGGIASSVQVSAASGAAIHIAQAVSPMEAKVSAVAATNNDDTAFYVIDRGSAGGFVVMSADDRLDPVLVIAPTGSFDPTPGTPLYDILCRDVRARMEIAEADAAPQSKGWRTLLDESDPFATSIAYASLSSVDDVRVAPLVQSQWSQSTVGGKKVYNLHTPKNCVCGCVATAGAQIMRYHQYPTSSVTPVTRTCYVNGAETKQKMIGGKYDWGRMPLVPTSSISDAECDAIGTLCYDVGVSIYMSWTTGSSGTGGYCLKEAFLDVFGYKNAMAWQLKSGTLTDAVIKNALLANFDYGCPVELSIESPSSGHSIVGDGYGYSGGSLYVHLNLGWAGNYDAWYHLPDIGAGRGYNIVDGTVYNIFPDGAGDLLTGRVLDAATDQPIADATIQAFDGSTLVGSVKTSAAGIYALRLPGGKTYSLVASAADCEPAEGSVYLPKSVTTRTETRYYYPGTGSVGNSWGNDFDLVRATEPVAPEAPTGVAAANGTSTASIRITWNASSGATDYTVYRAKENSSSKATVLASAVKPAYYDDTTADPGVTYYYWVKARNSVGESGFSAVASGWRAYAIPAAPTGVSASDGTSSEGVTVTWGAVSSATSYSVWRSETSSSASATSLASGLASTSYTDKSAVPGTTYYYWVRATNQGGTSGFSASDSGWRKVAAPSAPTGVSASDGLSATEIVVSWKAVDSATSYSVWRGTSSSSASATQIASGLSTTYYVDSTAVAKTTYYYWVKATNAGGTSGFSASDTGYLAVIVGPSTVAATDGTVADKVVVSWEASKDANSYEVWRGTVNAYSLASKIASPTSTSYNDTSAEPGKLYYYWVRAVTSAGTSAFSTSDSGYRPLGVPSGVSATKGNASGVTVSWSSVTGATSYQVGRGAEGATAPSETLGTSTSLSYVDATAVPGVTYAYFVRAVASAGSGGWSASATGSRSVPTPTNLAATTDRSDCIRVTWPVLSGATSYELMRATENSIAEAETITTTTSTAYMDETAEYGLTYYYFLRAQFAAGTSSWGAAAAGCRVFPKPLGVSASDGTSTANITVTWDAIDGVVFYQVWRIRANARDGINELLGTSTTPTYRDAKSLEPGVKYAYRVKAVFTTGTSGFSDSDEGYLKVATPVVKATDGESTTRVMVTWNAVAGAQSYTIRRGKTSVLADANDLQTDGEDYTTTDLFYDDQKADSGTLYYYWVRANGNDNCMSDYSAAETGYVGLPAVRGVDATRGDSATRVRITWLKVDGAQTYEVWRSDSDDSSGATRVAKGVAGLSWDDTLVTPGVKFWYWVRACDAGPGLWGTPDFGYRTHSAPTDVTTTTNQTDGVKVSWKGITSGVSYVIKRALVNDIDQAEIVATISDKVTYTDNTTVPGIVYYYWVMAYSDDIIDGGVSKPQRSGWSSSVSGFRAVAAPVTVTATDGTSEETVTITWSAATSAKRYEIWRSATTSSAAAELLGTTNKLVWVDAEVEPGCAYYYWIKSISALDTSVFSKSDLGYVSTPSPTGVTASDGESSTYVRITWDKAEGANSYAVWRAESENAEAATQVKVGLTTTTYDDTTVMPGKFYWYWVRPVSTPGPGVFAGPDRGFASLAAPADLVASSNNDTRVIVSWKAVKGATSYEIFRSESDDIDLATNEVFMTVTTVSYGDTNTVPAVKYWYWVRACAEAGVSALAGPADGFRLMPVPTNVKATDGESDEFVKITWSESWGATSYEIWRAENSAKITDAILVGTTNALEYLDKAATPGVSYNYWLKAVSEFYTTGFSATDKGWKSLPAPTTVIASDGTTSAGVEVKWSSVPDAVKYEVWRANEDMTTGVSRVFTSADAKFCVHTNTSAAAGVKYWFWVKSVCALGAGVSSKPDDGYRAVAAPTNLKASDGSSYDFVQVTWTGAAGAESYEIRRLATNPALAATNEYFSVTGTSFNDTNAVPGVIYSYWVRTVATLSSSEEAGPDEGYRKLQKIADVNASDGTSLEAVELSWTWPEGAAQCQIWRSTGTSVGTAAKIATVEAAEGASYADTTAQHGVKYFYWVNGLTDVEGEFGNYNDGWRGLLAPETVAATDGDSTAHTRITWSASPDATKYQIWRGTSADANSMTSIKELNAPAELVWEDTTGTAGTLYYYAVKAGGTGGWSELSTADAGYKKLMPPNNVSAEDGKQPGRIAVTWSPVTGATYYRVYRADSELGEKTELSAWQTATTFTDTLCQGTKKYWYFVMAAVDENGSRPSTLSAGDSGYAKEGGSSVLPVDLGGGITWPVTDNGDGTATTNALSFTSLEGGSLRFTGILGSVGSTTKVQTRVKTALDSSAVYTVESDLKIISAGTAELDLSTVWGTKPTLFVIGISTEKGDPLP